MAPDHRTRSPLRERERAISPQRRTEVDYGQDGDNHVLHIARTKQLMTFAGAEGAPRAWSWVLQALVHIRSNRGLGCPVDLLDQIVYGVDGARDAVFHTTKSRGTVARKAIGEEDGCITLAEAVVKHLRPPKRFLGALASVGETNGAVAFTSGGEATAIKSAHVEKIGKGQATAPAGTEALVLLVPTKARTAPCAELLLSLQHAFKLELGSAGAIHRSYRLPMLNGEFKRVPCKSSTINQKLQLACNAVIEWIESYSGARVLKLVLEFVEDAIGELWLVRSSECLTTQTVCPYSQQHHSPSAEQSKTNRLSMAKGVAGELSVLRYGYGIGESAPSLTSVGGVPLATTDDGAPSPSNDGSLLGSHRSIASRRPYTAISPSEVGPKGGQSLGDAEEWGFERNDSSPDENNGNSRRPKTTMNASLPLRVVRRQKLGLDNERAEVAEMFRGFAAPGERDPCLVGRTAAAGRALGSSQLAGMCHGDFCDVNLLDKIEQRAKFELEETGNGSLSLVASSCLSGANGNGTGVTVTGGENTGSSAFRKRLLQLDEGALQDHGVLPDHGEAASTPAAEGDGKRGKRGGRRDNGGVWGNGTVDHQPIERKDDGARWSEIPFSWVVRGRQEMHLIQRQLKQYRRGGKEPFVNHLSGLGESSVSMGALFPATYYQRVRVCNNCYRVYTVVDSARTKSVKRLDSRAARKCAGGPARDDGGNGRHGQQQPAAKRARVLAGNRANGGQAQGRKVPAVAPSSYHAGGESSVGVSRPEVDPSSAVRGRGEEEGEGDIGGASQETLALLKAQAAIDGLTRRDICELRSFSKPPAAVNMVAAALMIALTGDGEASARGWLASKKFMVNVDKLFAEIAGLDLDSIRVSQIRKLEAYAQNPAFRPDAIACVSLPASKLCAWVLGVLDAHRWKNGRGHPRTDVLGMWHQQGLEGAIGGRSNQAQVATMSEPAPVPPVSLTISQSGAMARYHHPIALFRSGDCNNTRPFASTTRGAAALGPAVCPFRPATTASVSYSRRRTRRRQRGERMGTSQRGPAFFRPLDSNQPMLPQAWIPAGAGLELALGPTRGAGAGSPTRADSALPAGAISRGPNNVDIDGSGTAKERKHQGGMEGPTRAGRAAARGRQQRTAGRLADATAVAPDPCGFERAEFLCSDGVTVMPYAVVGRADGGQIPSVVSSGDSSKHDGVGTVKTVLSFVTIHDFFDTLEKTFLLFKPLVLRYPGCQVLCFNTPGQAGTQMPPEPEILLTNEWIADRLDELMQHVDNVGLMPLSDRPFHLLGIGNGASIAAAFACRHASRARWQPTVRALVCVNGFAAVDAQLAAVLHSAQGAFRCFPPERPDLPTTFWSRFIFSDAYLKTVGSDLALNIFCAVANPLGAEGMLRIVKGALGSRDLRKDLPSITLPLILIQSTDNLLVNAANVDPFLEGRRPRHVWSHQLRMRAGGVTNTSSSAPVAASTTTGRPHTVGVMMTEAPTPTCAQDQGDQSSRAVSCLGLKGERALFESLASGRTGAFVAWVKGGHEVRQECKFAVTHILDLLAAPRGQAESFFRRGTQLQRASGGRDKRVGITAKPSATTKPLGLPTYGVRSHSNATNLGETAGKESEDGTMAQNAGHVGIASVAVTQGQTRTGKKGGRMERARDLDGGENRDEGRSVGGDVGVHVPVYAGPKYGYASLRKIREQEPSPTLPRCSDREVLTPTSSRARPRAMTAPAAASEQHRRRDRPGPENVYGGQSGQIDRLPCPLDGSLEAGRYSDTSDWNAGGESERVVVCLEKAIADFDTTLWDHRNKRKEELSLGSTTAPSASSMQGTMDNHVDGDFLLSDARESGMDTTENVGGNPSRWFDDNDAAWAAIAPAEGETAIFTPLRWMESEQRDTNSSNNISLGGGAERAAPTNPFARPLQPQPRGRNDAENTTSIERLPVCMNGDAARDPATAAVEKCAVEEQGDTAYEFSSRIGDSNEHVTSLQPQQSPGLRTMTPILRALPSGATTETRVTSDQSPTEVSPELKARIISSLPPTAGARSPSKVLAPEVSHDSFGNVMPTVTNQYVDVTPGMIPLTFAGADNAPVGITKVVGHMLTTDTAASRRFTTIVPMKSERVQDTTTVGETTSHDKGVVAVGVFPASAAAMESPDPHSTTSQRSAANWMTGIAPGAPVPPPPLSIAQAEAELAERVDQLKSRKATLEQSSKMALEHARFQRFGNEPAKRAALFSGEDRALLEQEEHRLAEVRRQAVFGRLQRGAEFEETDEALIRSGAAEPLGTVRPSSVDQLERTAPTPPREQLGGISPAMRETIATITTATKSTAPSFSPAGVSASTTTASATVPVRGMRPQHYVEAEDLSEGLRRAAAHQSAEHILDDLESLAARAKTAGKRANIEDFEQVEQQQRARQVERLGILHGHTEEERRGIMLAMTIRLQMFARSAIARHRVARLKAVRDATRRNVGGVISFQALVRGHLSRNRFRRIRRQALDEAVLGGRATAIQKVYRGRVGRLVYMERLKDERCRVLQRAARGFLGRRVARRKRALLIRLAARASSATKIQSAWRGKVARDAYLRTRCSWLASREIQRVYRGHLGRRVARRRTEWQAAGPGAERLKLGMRMIEDTKVAFQKQQGEIAALDRAQEKAEARVSSIHHQLTTSEAELSVLEGEMSELDHLERELVQLTHERDLITRGITEAAGLPKTDSLVDGSGRGGGGGDGGGGGGCGGGGTGDDHGGRGMLKSRKAEAYALEMQVQLKRAEREQRRQQLSAEFASTFAEVADKKRQLDRLSAAVADIEATRQRKSREFGHMQRNLMELLSEQKRELDHVREKGVQLETAAATSAAAAAATAQRARDHEAKVTAVDHKTGRSAIEVEMGAVCRGRAAAMYGQTEELMKFQFMSMSLSYFSSLNMMKQMREINADTTTAAIVGSADAAAAAAASTAAASIPSLKATEYLGGDAVTVALAERKDRVKSTRKEIEEAEESQRHPFPLEMSLWTIDDVCRWLDTLQLGEYKQAFREGKVDGSFLVELRESDLIDSIGMEHKLHLKKLILARQKLTPLSSTELSMASSVRREETATAMREGVPDLDTAFSQARHGKKKRLEQTLTLGFNIESEDESGNTLLLVAVQQLQMDVVEFLISRGANVNHTNAGGNTALHFAMSYDSSGKMGEFLINNGADDSIENKNGCSAYDGI